MEHIDNLFTKAVSQIAKAVKKKEIIIEIIKEYSKVDIKKSEIDISGHNLSLRILGVRKIEILNKKVIILQTLKDKHAILIERIS